jgi:hypothetical protein
MRWCPAIRPTTWRISWSALKELLAFTTRVELKLWPVIRNKVLRRLPLRQLYEAMDAAQHLVKLRPIAVELPIAP